MDILESESFKVGSSGEKILTENLKGSGATIIPIPISYFKGKGLHYDWDLEVTLLGITKTIEVKTTLTSGFPIEIWKDNNKTKRPSWWVASSLGLLDYVAFVSLKEKKIRLFKADLLRKCLELRKLPEYQTDKSEHNPGWIVWIKKEESYGWIKASSAKDYFVI